MHKNGDANVLPPIKGLGTIIKLKFSFLKLSS